MTKPPTDRARVLSGKQCHYCGAYTVLVDSSVVYKEGHGLIWMCEPCDAYVGCHGDTQRSKGSVANKMLRMLRKRAHAAFDPLWKDGGPMSRDDAYAELSKHLKTPPDETHIGMFDSEQCQVTERWAHVAQAIFRKPKPNEEMETTKRAKKMNVTAQVLSVKPVFHQPAKKIGNTETNGIMWYEVSMSDEPDYQIYVGTTARTATDYDPPPFAVGSTITYNESETAAKKPKLIPQASAPVARQATPPPAQGGVSPQLQQQPPAPKQEVPQATVTHTAPPAPQRPDNEVRKAKVSKVTFIETFRDGQTHKYGVAMDNGDKGVMFMQEKKDPFIVGEEVSYALSGFSSSGKPYAGGEKRIDVAVTGGGVATDKETFISNISALNTATAMWAVMDKTRLGGEECTFETIAELAKKVKHFATTNK